MSDALAAFGWVLAGVGMMFHLAGSVLGLWAFDYTLTWAVPLVGFALMAIGGAAS